MYFSVSVNKKLKFIGLKLDPSPIIFTVAMSFYGKILNYQCKLKQTVAATQEGSETRNFRRLNAEKSTYHVNPFLISMLDLLFWISKSLAPTFFSWRTAGKPISGSHWVNNTVGNENRISWETNIFQLLSNMRI